MNESSHPPAGRTYEQFVPGETFVTAERTIRDEDIRAFAELSGDHNRLHLDDDYARRGPFGQRIGHGLLGAAIATGLFFDLKLINETVIAFRELDWKFSLPLLIGDRIHAEATVETVKPFARLGGGLVVLRVRLLNQDGKAIQTGAWSVLIRGQG
jgi:acyl dehydratase